eukprot:scaffold117358_cov28-Tisochrysis_lutea.AAC.3
MALTASVALLTNTPAPLVSADGHTPSTDGGVGAGSLPADDGCAGWPRSGITCVAPLASRSTHGAPPCMRSVGSEFGKDACGCVGLSGARLAEAHDGGERALDHLGDQWSDGGRVKLGGRARLVKDGVRIEGMILCVHLRPERQRQVMVDREHRASDPERRCHTLAPDVVARPVGAEHVQLALTLSLEERPLAHDDPRPGGRPTTPAGEGRRAA